MSYVNADDVLYDLFFLSEKRIRGIIRKYGSSSQKDNGGFKDE